MEILVFAEQFRNGRWDIWEYECNPIEAKTVADGALARAKARELGAKPVHDDFLESARDSFDSVRGTMTNPRNGDTRVYCVCIDKLVIGVYDKIRQYAHRLSENREFVAAGMRMSA